MFPGADILIVGAGFYGATLAERIAGKLGRRVLVIDRRKHVGGNAFTDTDPLTGIEVHRYGAHLFHTPNEQVWRYLGQFTDFNSYRHRVVTMHAGKVYSLPINLGTICQFFGRHFTPAEARTLIACQAAEVAGRQPRNLEEKAISLVGRPLYEAFIRGYTAKQWQSDPRELPPHIIARLPVRYRFDDSYFDDPFQGQPVDGYTAIFEKMLASPLIETRLGVDFCQVRSEIPDGLPIVFTGPIDRYFGYSEGVLGWRTVDFEFQVLGVGDFQGASVINYSDEDVPFTRIVEFRHFNPERSYQTERTIIAREFSRSAGTGDEPYYPIGTSKDKAMLARYQERAEAEGNVHFGGRLGTYRYLDMHQAIAAALKAFETVFEPMFSMGEKLALFNQIEN